MRPSSVAYQTICLTQTSLVGSGTGDSQHVKSFDRLSPTTHQYGADDPMCAVGGMA